MFVFPRVCATAANQARQRRGREGETESIGEGAHTAVLGEGGGGRMEEEQTDKKKKKARRQEEGERLRPSSPWSAAKCTDRSDGNTQSVHLFEPAGRHYLSQWQLHPQTHPHVRRGGGKSSAEKICCSLSAGRDLGMMIGSVSDKRS